MARNKGAGGERELAKILNEHGIKAHRGYVQFKQSDLVGIDGIHPEVKRVEKLNIHEAMRQAIEEAEKRNDGAPTVFHRTNRGAWLVTMLLED
jgi:Holliday junction resolvase